MARVTVEDCIDKVDNRFDLVLMASHRARAISSGAPITVGRDNDKNPVVALREIGDGKLTPGDLREDVIHALQKHVEIDEPEEDHDVEIGAPANWAGDLAPMGDEEGDAGDEASVDDELQEDMLEASDESGVGDDDVMPDEPEGDSEPDDKIE